MSPTPPAARQAKSRTKKKDEGFVRLTLRFDAKTAARLRRLSMRRGTTQANVVALSLHLAEDEELMRGLRELAKRNKAAGGQ